MLIVHSFYVLDFYGHYAANTDQILLLIRLIQL